MRNKLTIFLVFFFYAHILLIAQDMFFDKLSNGRWFPIILVETLYSQNRDTIKEYVPNIESNEWYDGAVDDYVPWYNFLTFDFQEIIYSNNSIISFGDTGYARYFTVNSVTGINNKYKVSIDETKESIENTKIVNERWKNIVKLLLLNGTNILVFVFDQAYLTVYLNEENKQNIISVFCLLNDVTINELESLIYYNHCDLSKVTWPRRADGSMDYPPPKEAANVRFTPTPQEIATYTYATTSNLRLCSSATTSANIVTTIKQGTRLTVLSKGAEEKIDGITAPWIQVKTETGEVGSCFGGYLVEVASSSHVFSVITCSL